MRALAEGFHIPMPFISQLFDKTDSAHCNATKRGFQLLTSGKHRGLKWVDIPIDYLQWMLRQTDMDADATWCASQELSRRSQKQ